MAHPSTTSSRTSPGAGQERAEPTRWIAGLLAGVVAGVGCVLASAVLDNRTEVLAYVGAWLPAVGLAAGVLADQATTRPTRRRTRTGPGTS